MEVRKYLLRVKLFFTRIKYRFDMPKRLDELQSHLERALHEIHYHNTSDIEIREKLSELNNIDSVINKKLSHERNLRLSQKKRDNVKYVNEMATINNNFKEIDNSMSKLNSVVNKKLQRLDKMEELENIISSIRKELGVIHAMGDKFDKIEGLKGKVQIDYDRYIEDLKKCNEENARGLRIMINQYKYEISEFKKNDNAVVRLSSLETRITLLELAKKDKTNNVENIDLGKTWSPQSYINR